MDLENTFFCTVGFISAASARRFFVVAHLSLGMAPVMDPHEVQKHLLKNFGDRKLIATYRYLMSSGQAPARNLGLKLRWELLRRHAFDEAWFQKHAEQQDED